MAKWKETLEPYVKVIESVKTVANNPTSGEDLIVAAVIISDSGPSTPTLISSQSEFLKTYAAEDLTQDYTDSLDELYVSDKGSSLASTMWLNAYRLAGSTHMLICRASKAKDLIYSKPIAKGDSNSYVLKNTEILKKVPSFKFVLDRQSTGYTDGWAISVTDTGIIGNRVTDDGPIYDYKVDTLPDLVDQLNDTTKFFSPTYSFYTDVKCTEDSKVESDDISTYADDIVAVLFEEVYLGSNFLDTDTPLIDVVNNETLETVTDEDGEVVGDGKNDYQLYGATGTKVEVKGMCFITAVDPNWQEFGSNDIIDLNAKSYSGFEEVSYYATNLYNSRSDLKVRIRRFNHNAVSTKVTSDVEGQEPESPYTIATKVLDKYTNYGTEEPSAAVLNYDFYEFAIKDPDISDDWELFNVGNISGRGDITSADLNDNLSMLHLTLPDNLSDLDLNYYGYNPDNYRWVLQESGKIGAASGSTVITATDSTKPAASLPEITYKKSGALKNLVANSVYSVKTCQHYTVKTYSVDYYTGTWSIDTVAGKMVLDNALDTDGVVSNTPYTIPSNCVKNGAITEAGLKLLPNYGTSAASNWLDSDTLKNNGKIILNCGDKQQIIGDDGNPTGEEVDLYYILTFTVTGNIGSWSLSDASYSDMAEDELPVAAVVSDTEDTETVHDSGDLWAIPMDNLSEYYIYKLTLNGEDEISIDLSLKRTNSAGETLTTILDVSDNDIMLAWDRLEEDERYVVEGMTDLGNTYSIIQNYMANIAVNSNYFYAVSTINSTNYMTIANKKSKVTKDTPKLYFLAPWDYDDGTVGYLYNASPSVLYWECVSRNKSNSNEFAPSFGQNTGIVTPVNLTTDFKKSERQLLLTKKINTVFHDVNIDRIYINDNYTAQSDDNVLKEENIERTVIHISKNMPSLLNQFKGRINSSKTRKAVEDVIEYWFTQHLLPATGELIDDYKITCDDDDLNTDADIRANRLNVKIEVRYINSIKYITVYNEAFPIGVDLD